MNKKSYLMYLLKSLQCGININKNLVIEKENKVNFVDSAELCYLNL